MAGVDYQIEALSERIGALPKELDPKPLFDQLQKFNKEEEKQCRRGEILNKIYGGIIKDDKKVTQAFLY